MNVVLFLTDQERSIQHFPSDWEQRNLPGLTRLKANGLSFDNAFTNACMCSPARSTLMTGYFPAQHGVKYTLVEDMTRPKNPQSPLPVDLQNIASVASAAGYNVTTQTYKFDYFAFTAIPSRRPAGRGGREPVSVDTRV